MKILNFVRQIWRDLRDSRFCFPWMQYKRRELEQRIAEINEIKAQADFWHPLEKRLLQESREAIGTDQFAEKWDALYRVHIRSIQEVSIPLENFKQKYNSTN